MDQAAQAPEPLKPEAASAPPTSQGPADTSQASAPPFTGSFQPTASFSTSTSESASPPIRVGASLDGYVLLEQIGRGGMGVVFKARQPNSEQTVAVKVIRDGLFGDQEANDRFLQEV